MHTHEILGIICTETGKAMPQPPVNGCDNAEHWRWWYLRMHWWMAPMTMEQKVVAFEVIDQLFGETHLQNIVRAGM